MQKADCRNGVYFVLDSVSGGFLRTKWDHLVFSRYSVNNNLIGVTADPNEINNAVNALFVIFTQSVVGLIWLWMNKRKLEPNTVVNLVLDLSFLPMPFMYFTLHDFSSTLKTRTSLNIFTLAYLVITVGELCLSQIGLSITLTKLSPKRLVGMMMGMWFPVQVHMDNMLQEFWRRNGSPK